MINKEIIFAPGGNSLSFAGRSFPEDLPAYLARFELNGYEIECGRGFNVSAKTYSTLPSLAAHHGIYLTLHAPYYISLSSESEETRDKSVQWLVDSARVAKRLSANKVVVHSGSCAKMTREHALELSKDTLLRAKEKMNQENITDIIICPETMGKINQIGTLEETLELAALDDSFLPCVDFGHLNARSLGGVRTVNDYKKMFDLCEEKLGFERAASMHIHFSKVMYTVGGEKMHLKFDDMQYGPDFKPMLDEIKRRGYKPSIVCESSGTQAEDCKIMKDYYESINLINNN
ncbi:MAG: TIM barrel protein [Oscillospiraceae bacterium]|jgi:deoxyribonuclease-4|nr:TIM barrel protein [Oscillospiraceae bacterium]